MGPNVEQHKEGIEKDIRRLEALKRLNGNPDAEPVFDLMIDTVVKKMIAVFSGDGPKSLEEFYKVRGEVIAYLFPLQEIRGAEAMRDHLKSQLQEYYGKPS